MNYFFCAINHFVSSKLFQTLSILLFYSFFSFVSAQTEERIEVSDNEISVMEFVFEKSKSPTLKEDEFPKKAIQILSKHESITSYKLKYDVEIALNSEKEDNYTITFISKEVTEGMYRNFSIADYLLPEQISFDVTWGHKTKDGKTDSRTIKKEFSRVEFDINHKTSVDVSFPLTADFRPILIENIIFHYGDLQERGLSSRVKLIDEYYNESQKIEGFLVDLNAIQKEQGIESNSKKGEEAKQKLQPIENAIRKLDAYAQELITEDEDPVKLRQQLSKLKTSYTQTRAMLFAATAESEKICQEEYQKGKQFLEDGKGNSAQLAFSSVLQKCPTHIPSLILRAQLFYQEGNFDNARQDLSHLPKGKELNSVLEKDNDLQIFIESVYFDLFAFFIRKGDYASKNLEFDEAFSFFSQAKEICEENPFLPNCNEQLLPRLENAKKDQLEYLDAQIRNSLYENNLSEAVGFVVKSKNILTISGSEQEPEGELKNHADVLTQKLDKRMKDAIIIQNWEEAIEALELNVGLKTGLTYSDSTLFWKEVGQNIEKQQQKDLLIYATARYSQLSLPITNSLLKRLIQTDISKNEWQQLGQDIGKKDYYLQPTAKPEEIITKYSLLNPSLDKNFQKGYFQVWKELGKE